MRALLLTLLIAALLAGCGWRLRGGGVDGSALADRVLWVESQVRGDLPAMVGRSLRLAGASTADSAEAAEAVLVLAREQIERRPIAVNANARVQEYELGYRLHFSLRTPAGASLLPEQEITVSQVYRYDRENVLSSQSQETVVGDRLRQDAIRLLLPRVQAALRESGGA